MPHLFTRLGVHHEAHSSLHNRRMRLDKEMGGKMPIFSRARCLSDLAHSHGGPIIPIMELVASMNAVRRK